MPRVKSSGYKVFFLNLVLSSHHTFVYSSFNPRPTGPFVGSDDEEDFLFAAADHVAED
jgi:hypothetical protein